ncbi:MAG: cytochrome c oxidase subunit II transmembrane domain-containing protein, partial [Amylibacter sp.]
MSVAKIFNTISMALTGLMVAGSAFAQDSLERIGKPTQDGLNFQPPSTELARDLVWVDNFLLVIITVITVFVTGLMIYVVIRFNRKANPKAA